MLLDVDVAKKLDSNWIDYNLGLLVWVLSYNSLKERQCNNQKYQKYVEWKWHDNTSFLGYFYSSWRLSQIGPRADFNFAAIPPRKFSVLWWFSGRLSYNWKSTIDVLDA